MTSIKTLRTPIHAIDRRNSTYQISTPKSKAGLVDSIQAIGLITPPLLHRKGPGYVIVSGFRRIDACRALNLAAVEARILDEAVPRLECARAAIVENSFQRDLNLVEISRALNLLEAMGVPPSDLEKVARSLALPSNPSLTAKLKKIQQMTPLLQQAIVDNQIALDVALKLAGLAKDDGRTLIEIFLNLGLSRGKQKEMLTHIVEIAARDDLQLSSIMASRTFQDVLQNPNLDRHQKTSRLRAYLKERRFPHICAAEKEFLSAIQPLKLGDKMVLKHPDYFEGTDLTLHISFKNLNELYQQLKILDQELKKTSLKK